MKILRRISRLYHIFSVLAKHGLDEFVVPLSDGRLKPVFWLTPDYWKDHPGRPRGVRLREALVELGPIFVKFGQLLSARPDLVPEDVAMELTKLQDKVPPFPGQQAREKIEKAYGEPLENHFSDFEETPVASASVAQVHNAQLLSGEEVVVKVVRPGIEPTIQRDVELLYSLARLAEKHWSEGQRLRPVEVVEEYDKTIHDELDMQREGANASQLRANFEGSDIIYVPQVYWDHTRRDVLVMERIDGIPIRDIDAIKAAGIDMKTLAHNGVEIFFTQAFRDGFFHADMHPGNIFVGENGQYRAVDFGIVGALSDADKRYLADNFLAFFNRDYRGVAEAHVRAGWVPRDTRVEEFESAIRTVCEPIFAKPISEISFGGFVMRLFQTARRFNMPVQPQLVLLQKTLLQIEGLGRQLYPQLDLWETAKPFLERWMSEQIGPRKAIKALRENIPKLGVLAPELPILAYELLSQSQIGKIKHKSKEEDFSRKNTSYKSRSIFGSLMIFGALFFPRMNLTNSFEIYNLPLLSWLLGIGGIAVLLSMQKK